MHIPPSALGMGVQIAQLARLRHSDTHIFSTLSQAAGNKDSETAALNEDDADMTDAEEEAAAPDAVNGSQADVATDGDAALQVQVDKLSLDTGCQGCLPYPPCWSILLLYIYLYVTNSGLLSLQSFDCWLLHVTCAYVPRCMSSAQRQIHRSHL